MNKKFRTALFSVLVLFFLLVVPASILYCLGWRIDWKARTIIQVGYLYCKASPKSVEIYSDGKLVKKTDFFFGSALVENLISGEYNIEVRKAGFHSWAKKLEIEKNQVTEIKNVVLVPENPVFNFISNKIDKFFVSPDGKKVVLLETNTDSKTQIESWALKLYETDTKIKSQLIEEKDVKNRISPNQQERNELIALKFSPDSRRVLLEIGQTEQLKYYSVSLDRTPPVVTTIDLAINGETYFNPKNSQQLFVVQGGKVSIADLEKKDIALPVLNNVIAFSAFDDGVYYLDELGFLNRADLSLQGAQKLNRLAIIMEGELEYKIERFKKNVVVEAGSAAYILNNESEIFEKFDDNINGLIFSPDAKKLAYVVGNEIKIFFAAPDYDLQLKARGSRISLGQLSPDRNMILWWNKDYLIFGKDNKIKIVETDDRDKLNIVNLADFNNLSQLFWEQNSKTLYVLADNSLYNSANLSP